MGLLNKTQKQYYESPNNYGNYQFVSLEDIINQFMVVYVGEDKLITKARKVDVQFHGMRALQQLSFDTLKSIKSQEIVVPPSLTMPLPHDYVNYVKLVSIDSSGIEHVLIPTSKTSNPQKIDQSSDGSYIFQSDENLVVNGDFASLLQDSPWNYSTVKSNHVDLSGNTVPDKIEVASGKLSITTNNFEYLSAPASRAYSVWQEIDVSNYNTVSISATATSAAAGTIHGNGIIKLGLSTVPGSNFTNPYNPYNASHQINVTNPDVAFIEWNDGNATATDKELTNIDVSAYDTLYVVVQMRTIWSALGTSGTDTQQTNTIDDISVEFDGAVDSLKIDPRTSTTRDRFKEIETSNRDLRDYDDRDYDFVEGQRYGIDPQHAQDNGTFFIDEIRGNIHFGSFVAGKTIILKYISDSLGTDGEMQVHKFAEEAMYKCIAYAILSGKRNIPEYIINRLRKEKFAETRKAKLRLSNIKLEELTQVLRGKSKWIKH